MTSMVGGKINQLMQKILKKLKYEFWAWNYYIWLRFISTTTTGIMEIYVDRIIGIKINVKYMNTS